MYKIAALGDKDSVFAFASIGFDVFALNEAKAAAKQLRSLAENGYAVIYITEALASQIKNEIDKYSEAVTPSIILIPGVKGNTGDGMNNLKRFVEQAVGSDILS